MQERDALIDRARELTQLLQDVSKRARERQEVFVELHKKHRMTYEAIGAEVGLSRQAVEAVCKGRGIKNP